MKMIETSNSDYKKFLKKNLYYIDKTMLIEELLTGIGEVVLITRPRRFGKTLNLSMLKYYFDIAEDNEYLFAGKKIERSSIYKEHLNKYPVIFLTLKDLKGLSWEEDYKKIKTMFYELYNQYRFLIESKKLLKAEKEHIESVVRGEDEIDYSSCLKRLSGYLHSHYDKKVIILLDEYDTLINKNIEGEHYIKAISFLRNMIGSAFKGNDYLEKGVLTGILRVAKEELFSGANNILVRTVMNDDFNDKFGFTEEETLQALKDFNLEDKAQEVKDWYNGYSFGADNKVTIYNPFSINNYIIEKKAKSYWINIDSNIIIKNIILQADKSVKEKINNLIVGESVTAFVKESIIMSQLSDSNYVWSLFLFSGYLTPVNETNKTDEYNLRLVNNEVREAFKQIVDEALKQVRQNPYLILDAIVKGDIDTFKKELKEIVKATLSYNDIKSENSYHMFIAGMTVFLKPYNIVDSNEESGYGRYYIMIEPLDKKGYGYIIELKRVKLSKKLEESKVELKLKEASEIALKQIEDNEYYSKLKERKIKNICLIGLAFEGKRISLSYKHL